MPKIAMKLFSRRETDYKIKNSRPLMLGVVGDSGCGKSTLVRGLHQLFGKGRVTEICLDDYHRYDRAERLERQLTALDPAANNLELMADHLALLRQGKRILKPVYDHSTGRFAHPEAVMPRQVVVVHGLFTLFNPELAGLFDLGVYLDPQEALRVEWKIARDTQKRGYKLDEVLHQLEERRLDAARYIQPQKVTADLVVGFRRPVSLLHNSALDVRLSPRADWVWPSLQSEGSASRWLTISPGQSLEISGRVDPISAARLARAFIYSEEMNPLLAVNLSRGELLKNLGFYTHNTGSNIEQRQSLPLALTQLLIVGRLLGVQHPIEQSQVA